MLLTTLCYIEHKGHLLLLHRTSKADDINEGKWIGVGGKFADRESPEECLLREVKEETGYTLTSWRFRGIVTFLQEGYETEYMCLYTADDFLVPAGGEFEAEDAAGEFAAEAVPAGGRLFSEIPVDLHPGFVGEKATDWPVPYCSEGDLAWIEKERIRELPMWEGDRIFFDLIEKDSPFFSLRLEYSGDSLIGVSLDGRSRDIISG